MDLNFGDSFIQKFLGMLNLIFMFALTLPIIIPGDYRWKVTPSNQKGEIKLQKMPRRIRQARYTRIKARQISFYSNDLDQPIPVPWH